MTVEARMAADKIQDEAIERVARRLAADEHQKTPGARHYSAAEGVVDALGGLLATSDEWRVRYSECGHERVTGVVNEKAARHIDAMLEIETAMERRYVGEWREVERG